MTADSKPGPCVAASREFAARERCIAANAHADEDLLKRETITATDDGRTFHRGVIDDKTPDAERERYHRSMELRWNWARAGTAVLEQCWYAPPYHTDGDPLATPYEWRPVPTVCEAAPTDKHRELLHQQIAAILAPAIDARAPYAKVMIDRLAMLLMGPAP